MLITGGLVLMTVGLVILAVLPASTPVWVLTVLMALVGLAGPLVMPPVDQPVLLAAAVGLAAAASSLLLKPPHTGHMLEADAAVAGAIDVAPAADNAVRQETRA